MLETLGPVKDLAPLVAPFIPAIIDTFVKPKLQRLSKFLKKSKTASLVSVEATFTEYLERTYQKHFFIPILIFQNQQRRLEDIYIPLTVRSNAKAKTFVIDSYPQEFLPAYKKVLIRDTAGMGKSTLMKRLFLSCLETKRGIPIFIELRKLRSADSIANFILRELNPIHEELDQEVVLQLIKDGNFIFFLDGYDEIAQSEREKVTQNLHDFISKTGKNLFIMTSRPETSLASFPDFMEFDIQPLKLEEAFSLLRKYDEAGDLSAEIISKLQGKTLESVKDFLKNPLLVSLLYKSYEYKPTIPLKKHNFYRQVFDALYESHDLTKEGAYIRDKYCQLDTDSFHTILRSLGFITLKHGIEYDKDEILAFLQKAKDQCSTIEFRESKFLDDLLQTVPIFTIESNKYRWSHKSLQDYFAAQFIWLDSNKDKIDILRRMVKSEESQKYFNVLDLYYDMDYKSFRQTIIYDYLSEALIHYETPMAIQSPRELSNEEIDFIKINTFGQFPFLVPDKTFKKIEAANREELDMLYRKKIEDMGFSLAGFTLQFWVGLQRHRLVGFGNHNSLLTGLLLDKNGRALHYGSSLPKKARKRIAKKIQKYPGFSGFSSSLTVIEDKTKVNQIFDEFFPFVYSQISLDIPKIKKMRNEIESEIEKEEANSLFKDL